MAGCGVKAWSRSCLIFRLNMLRVLLFLLHFSTFAEARERGLPIWQQDNYRWQQIQLQHLQTQQQLQAQDQYRRQLLLQDQERQIQKLRDQQQEIEDRQRSLMMREHTDKLRLYSKPLKAGQAGVKKKQK